MDEIENTGSNIEEVANPPIESAQEPIAQEQPQTASQDTEWIKRLRKDREEAIRQAKEKDRELAMQKELMQQILAQRNHSSQQSHQEDDVIESLAKEEYVPGEKVAKALRQQQEGFERQLNEMKRTVEQRKFMDAMSDLRRQYPDLDDVVNTETLSIVRDKNPALAEQWARLDDYSIAVQAYPYIKHAGILDYATNANRSQQIEKKIEQNKKTVQTPQAFDRRPMAQAFSYDRLDKKAQENLFNEMHHYASQSGGY